MSSDSDKNTTTPWKRLASGTVFGGVSLVYLGWYVVQGAAAFEGALQFIDRLSSSDMRLIPFLTEWAWTITMVPALLLLGSAARAMKTDWWRAIGIALFVSCAFVLALGSFQFGRSMPNREWIVAKAYPIALLESVADRTIRATILGSELVLWERTHMMKLVCWPENPRVGDPLQQSEASDFYSIPRPGKSSKIEITVSRAFAETVDRHKNLQCNLVLGPIEPDSGAKPFTIPHGGVMGFGEAKSWRKYRD